MIKITEYLKELTLAKMASLINKDIDDLKMNIYKIFRFKKDRKYLFAYISQGLKNGGTSRQLLQSILIEFEKSHNYQLVRLIEDTLSYMEQYGYSDAESMRLSGFIDEMEYLSIESISKSEPHKAYDFINTRKDNEDNFKWAVGMLFFPVIFVLSGYLIFQPELAVLTKDLLDPVNSVSKKEIEIPEYFKDRVLFGSGLAFVFFLMVSLFGFVSYLKRNNPKLLFKIFIIFEREFILNNFEIMLSLLKSGQSQMRAVELLSENQTDIISKRIFSEIKEDMKEGESHIFEILSKYGFDSATISYMRSGEMNNFLIESVETSLEYNKERYDSLVKKLTKYLPLIGEIIMTIVLLKPILDIITVTTVGTLSFEV